MEITLQYFDGCPNWETTDELLTMLIEQLVPSATLLHHRIDTPEEAATYDFRGSPTVLIDGTDPFAEPDAPVGLACRVYVTEAGWAGSPSLRQIQDAITAAM